MPDAAAQCASLGAVRLDHDEAAPSLLPPRRDPATTSTPPVAGTVLLLSLLARTRLRRLPLRVLRRRTVLTNNRQALSLYNLRRPLLALFRSP